MEEQTKEEKKTEEHKNNDEKEDLGENNIENNNDEKIKEINENNKSEEKKEEQNIEDDKDKINEENKEIQKLEEDKKTEEKTEINNEYKNEEKTEKEEDNKIKDNIQIKDNNKVSEKKEEIKPDENNEIKDEDKKEEKIERKEKYRTEENIKIEDKPKIEEKIEKKEDLKQEEKNDKQKLEKNNIENKELKKINNEDKKDNQNSIENDDEEEKLDDEDKKEEDEENKNKEKEKELIEQKREEEKKLKEKEEQEKREREIKEEQEKKEREEMAKNSFELSLWNKYEIIHQRYKLKMECYENTIEIFSKLLSSLKDHQKVLNTIISKNYILFPGTESTQGNAMNIITKGIEIEFDQLKSSIDLLKKVFIEQFKQHKDKEKNAEKDAYNHFIKVMNKYDDSKNILEKNKTKYYQSIKLAESSLRNSKTLKVKNFDNSNETKNAIQKLEVKAKELLIEAKKNYDKYISSIKEANKNREESIEKQKAMLKMFQSLEEKDGEFNINLLKNYYNRQQEKNEANKIFLEEMNILIQDIDLKKDNQSIIALYNSDEKPDQVIELIQYEPKIDFENASNPDEFKINHEIIIAMKAVFPELIPNFNIEKENKKQEMRELSKKIFVTNIPFTDEEKNKLLDYLKEKWSQTYFLIYLSKQRTKGRFARSQKLVKDLAEILNIILNTAEKEKDYHAAKNCMILSQTYYYDEKNKDGNIKKKYLLDFIINYKWLRSPNFWRGIIQEMIDFEAKNYMKLNPDEPSLFDENNKKSTAKLANICFSQLLPYANNMKEFYMDIRIILKVIDEFVEKYDLPNNLSNTIYSGIVSDKKEEVERMRNEYKNNPNFENELMTVEEVKKQREGK